MHKEPNENTWISKQPSFASRPDYGLGSLPSPAEPVFVRVGMGSYFTLERPGQGQYQFQLGLWAALGLGAYEPNQAKNTTSPQT